MPRLQWHWLPKGQTAGRTGSQNLSGTMQGMRWQGAGGVAASLKAYGRALVLRLRES